ncbi:MAG: GGDEF domain-containing protein [Parcubacteria group bacterium]|jgi:GGDEF domain-containing protein
MPNLNALQEVLERSWKCSFEGKDAPTIVLQKQLTLAKKHGFHEGDAWPREKIVQILLNIFLQFKGNPEKIFQELEKVLLMIADANGLKPINDIGSHALGNIFLDKIASALHNEKVNFFCQQFAITKEICRSGGDEFHIIAERTSASFNEKIGYEILPKQVLTRRLASVFHRLLTVEVFQTPFSELDFHAPTVYEKLEGRGQDLLEKAEQHLGGKFFLNPSISVGECVFADAFSKFIEKGCDANIPIKRLAESIMGIIEDTAEELMFARKKSLREALWTAASPIKKMQAFMITRSKRDREIEILLNDLRQTHTQRECLNPELFGLYQFIECKLEELLKKDSSGEDENLFFSDLQEAICHLKAVLTALDNKMTRLF